MPHTMTNPQVAHAVTISVIAPHTKLLSYCVLCMHSHCAFASSRYKWELILDKYVHVEYIFPRGPG